MTSGAEASAARGRVSTSTTRGLSYRREKLVRIKKKNEDRIGAMIERGRVKTIFNSEVVEIAADLVRLKVGSIESTLPNDYVFVFAGQEPPFGFLRQIGVRFGGAEKPAPASRAGA